MRRGTLGCPYAAKQKAVVSQGIKRNVMEIRNGTVKVMGGIKNEAQTTYQLSELFQASYRRW
ncbi:hypothetical protein HMPREF1487_08575 [Pseudomonas sp. HPB0071]|uniref:Uncharacterized protein n=1 Tax=Pseudomonas luteola TaxID=47886 RepID=A0A2X2DCE9_PSELU|nr:hypothetical protein HMPREF1487_08575 [Pseudomonas sp. HPB0071]RRW42165.1 hypothetical protein EGJ50_21465 [Pseudomonas luteola]SHJ50928.1 hypothetical protein SAMN05216295_11587 [Pseudomonas zeshuii]SPZ16663.1 Uncharacterised protein [Pseudomonas luteola]